MDKKQLIQQEIEELRSLQIGTYKSPKLDYFKDEKQIDVYLPYDTLTFVAKDNNKNNSSTAAAFDSNLSFTTDYVVEESSGSLKKKVDIVFPSVYENTSQLQEPISIRFIKEGDTFVRNIKIWMEKSFSNNGFSAWRFTSDQSTTMLVTEGAFTPNSSGKISDINLLLPIFALKTAGFNVTHTSNDSDIKLSFNKFSYV